MAINLEQLLAINLQWLLVVHYRAESIVKNGSKIRYGPCCRRRKSAGCRSHRNNWARMRGIFVAERIASNMVKLSTIRRSIARHETVHRSFFIWGCRC